MDPRNTAVAVQGSSPAPFMMQITGRTGKVLGERYKFAGRHSAKELRDNLKGKGLKGTELTKAVNQALTGEKDVRVIVGQAMVTTLIQDGYIPDFCDKKAKSASFRFVKPVEPKATVSNVEKKFAELDPEERAELLKRLNDITTGAKS